MDTYVKRATKAFSFLWSFIALVEAALAITLGAATNPAPDYLFVVFGVVSVVGGGVCGFMHGVTLSAARTLDAAQRADANHDRSTAPRCYQEYCAGDAVCPDRHS